MPRPRGTGKGESHRFNVRLDGQTAGFYRSKANEHGISMSEFIRQVLVQGVIAETVQEIEGRLRATVKELNHVAAVGEVRSLHDDVLKSIFMSEAVLSLIVSSRDMQEFYSAQDKASEKPRLHREAFHGK